MKDWIFNLVPGLIGAVIGGIVGYALYKWGLSHNLKAGVIPGAFVGLGSGLLSARPSQVRGVICGLGALALGIYAEWANAPFIPDESLGYFLTHVHKLNPIVLIMIILGTFLGYRWGGDGFKPGLLGSSKPTQSRQSGRELD
jgi:hypothetical protein